MSVLFEMSVVIAEAGGISLCELWASWHEECEECEACKAGPQQSVDVWMCVSVADCLAAVMCFSCRGHGAYWPLEGANESGALTLH